jgi:hypothetical protein
MSDWQPAVIVLIHGTVNAAIEAAHKRKVLVREVPLGHPLYEDWSLNAVPCDSRRTFQLLGADAERLGFRGEAIFCEHEVLTD